jgi:hypothetical protein
MAIPLGCLKAGKQVFHPPLTSGLTAAIDAISVGHLEKVRSLARDKKATCGSDSMLTDTDRSISPSQNPSGEAQAARKVGTWTISSGSHRGTPRPRIPSAGRLRPTTCPRWSPRTAALPS